MEFYTTAHVSADEKTLHRCLDIASLPQWCASIDKVLEHAGNGGRIYCLWGEFAVRREPIRGGVRYTLPRCPNALAWTVTVGLPPDPELIVVHCTINRRSHDTDFVASIEEFVGDWKNGLERHLR